MPTLVELMPGVSRDAVKMLNGNSPYLTIRLIKYCIETNPGQYPTINQLYATHTKKGALGLVSRILLASDEWELRNADRKSRCYKYIGAKNE